MSNILLIFIGHPLLKRNPIKLYALYNLNGYTAVSILAHGGEVTGYRQTDQTITTVTNNSVIE